MKISEYVKKYSQRGIPFWWVWGEFKEFIAEVVKWNKKGMAEEWQDFLLGLQGWLWNDFKIDGEIWRACKNSAKKFADREVVWQEIYKYVGLKDLNPGFMGNYKRLEKIVNHLSEFGIDKNKAEEAYQKIVLKK